MITNQINFIRQDIQRYFDKDGYIKDSEIVELSDSGLYSFSSTRYLQNDIQRNWVICKIEIWNIESSKIIFEYLTDSDDCDHCACWFSRDNNEYLFLPEAHQGQSVFDVNANKLYSFYSGDDAFIWKKVHLSSNLNILIVEGCYWACPTEFRTYDISDITNLPYPVIEFECKY